MRQITKQAARAFLALANYRSGNTTVTRGEQFRADGVRLGADDWYTLREGGR